MCAGGVRTASDTPSPSIIWYQGPAKPARGETDRHDETSCVDRRTFADAADPGNGGPCLEPTSRTARQQRDRGVARGHGGCRSVVHQPLSPAAQPMPDFDPGGAALRRRTAALPQGLPGGDEAPLEHLWRRHCSEWFWLKQKRSRDCPLVIRINEFTGLRPQAAFDDVVALSRPIIASSAAISSARRACGMCSSSLSSTRSAAGLVATRTVLPSGVNRTT